MNLMTAQSEKPVIPAKAGIQRVGEFTQAMESAAAREKAVKEWKRVWKPELIENGNPTWRGLYDMHPGRQLTKQLAVV